MKQASHSKNGPGAAGPSVSSATGCKNKREKKSALKAAAVPGEGDMGGSPTKNLKEALFLEMLEDSSDSPSSRFVQHAFCATHVLCFDSKFLIE